MDTKVLSTRNLTRQIHEIYGFEASTGLISNITDKILPIAKKLQNRQLDCIYLIVFL